MTRVAARVPAVRLVLAFNIAKHEDIARIRRQARQLDWPSLCGRIELVYERLLKQRDA